MADQQVVYGDWGGDPGHSGAKPQMHLQGGTGPVYMQAPSDQSVNYMNTRGQSSDPWTPWDSTSLDSSGGDTPNRGSDSHPAQT